MAARCKYNYHELHNDETFCASCLGYFDETISVIIHAQKTKFAFCQQRHVQNTQILTFSPLYLNETI